MDEPEKQSPSPANAPRRARIDVALLDEQQKHEAIREMARRFELVKQQLDACKKSRK